MPPTKIPVLYSSAHSQHAPPVELWNGKLVNYPEVPRRIELFLCACRDASNRVGSQPMFKDDCMTKTLYALALCLLLAGCHGRQHNDSVRVIVDDHSKFPASLAGRWVADRHGWQIVFAPDGRITSVVLSLGRVEIVPGTTATIPTRGGGQGIFEPGLWTVQYEPQTEQLTVKIVMNHVHVEMGNHILEGKSTDVLSGPVHAIDGVWQVQWTVFTDYDMQTPDGERVPLSTDPTYGETHPLTFEKVPSQ